MIHRLLLSVHYAEFYSPTGSTVGFRISVLKDQHEACTVDVERREFYRLTPFPEHSKNDASDVECWVKDDMWRSETEFGDPEAAIAHVLNFYVARFEPTVT